MPRVAGVMIPDEKTIQYSLTYIYGIGLSLSKKVLKEANISLTKKAKDLNQEELGKLKEVIEKNHRVEGELKRDIMANIKRLKDISAWKGVRHAKGLPVRGQTTRVNSRTVRGNVRKTAGSGRKAPPSPK
jgi:small subunit ribosomal protein S13